ncbi:Tat pathway signal sequence domain protein [Sphingobium yanoikuyae]|uniref:Tat pathway signal sequence domain protein n=2 Tax=Sphingobium yanoikuyae TaxID=13690 RepID=A0AA43BC95_SPHYA|nr:Tat pathway signal sequence domain protein [Sphingobium yanoikuyae]MDH2131637.1 Tat pathway signal sequence domain protein [Sphingobium yanoikuyae]MDH2148636.1 Tat pathway signal sequence domain protein [Sphingobium yanoikuyae]MDH2167230.1 Tat pathway signal sequence domain protein [Sphingobium yanoikuyae]
MDIRAGISRRDSLKAGLMASAIALLPGAAQAATSARGGAMPETPVRWIDDAAPPLSLGQTFGVPWPRGVLRAGKPLSVQGADGTALPSQHWTLATWPDGSIKWTAHALPAGTGQPGALRVVPGKPAAPQAPILVRELADRIEIQVGALRWSIGRSGNAIIQSAQQGNRTVVGPLTLVASVDSVPEGGTRTPFTGRITSATVEQKGPVRAVVKLTGIHEGQGRQILPFTLRLYAHAGGDHLRIVHSFIFDGDPAKDFISGIGLTAAVPMAGAPHDRHVRLATADDGLFSEAVRPLTGLRRDPGKVVRAAQIAGKAVPMDAMAPGVAKLLDRIPTWGDFDLTQLSADGFAIAKRTQDGHAWVDSVAGSRSQGLGYIGSPQGGAAIATRYFWQRHPSQISIRDAESDMATLTAWLWSPDAKPMDMRSYRGVLGMEGYDAQNEGLDITYEDYEPGWDAATGVARTSELTLWACAATPSADTLAAMAQANAVPPQLMVTPDRIHEAGVFGIWSLPDRSTPMKARIEDQNSNLVDFYVGEVDRRRWYGFWNHGDIMHTYDFDRHVWRYDIGGFAWDNSELSPDLWFWTSVLRTGNAAAFRFAEALTRHTGEVDVYHLGRFKGLGTRHGVQHWSDSSKQPRVSNAMYRRIFYYLTADERAGDLMRDLVTSDLALEHVEIGRKVPGAERNPLPAGVIDLSFGTMWCSVASAWLTEWERTGDKKWRERLLNGMDSIGRLKYGWLAGSAPYDLKTGRFMGAGDKMSISHLNAVFGALEVNAELLELLDVPRYRTAWLDYCRWFNASPQEWKAKFDQPFGRRNLKEGHSRLTAYVARETGDRELAVRAWKEFLGGEAGLGLSTGDPRVALKGPAYVRPIVEWPDVSTNAASQWGLAAIENLALIPDALADAAK